VNIIFAAVLALSQAFGEGETLDYNLTWMRITGGTARMTIAPVQNDEELLRITSVGKSSTGFSRIFKVHDEIESIVARRDFSTLKYTKRIDENGDKKVEITTVENGVATRTRKKVKKVDVPRPVYDPISIIYHLRTLDLSVGRTHELTVVADGKLYNVRAKVTRRETLQTPAGKFQTVVVEPRMESGGVEREEKLYIWYSDDDRHIPVRIRTDVNFGSITATLRRIGNGVTSTQPPQLTSK
jgi:Protein of unknown function (DUF3108)